MSFEDDYIRAFARFPDAFKPGPLAGMFRVGTPEEQEACYCRLKGAPMDPNRKAEKAEKRRLAEERYQAATAGLVFSAWPKIARLNRDIVITEKIDGTNAAIGIGPPAGSISVVEAGGFTAYSPESGAGRVWAQSRSRIITPEDDNMGFARWVQQHEAVLAKTLGPGLHFGEWWGVGIQRGYDLSERRFSLFNVEKWGPRVVATDSGGYEEDPLLAARDAGVALYTVPMLYRGPWVYERRPNIPDEENYVFAPHMALDLLSEDGSFAAPGYRKPEGVCVFHRASGIILKATIEGDEEHKRLL